VHWYHTCDADESTVSQGHARQEESSSVTGRQIIKTIVSANGQRRVEIFERDDGQFSFVEEKLYALPDGSAVWGPFGSRLSICDSAVTAEREARSRIAWLVELA
jgi:hypothetical protein